MSKDYNKKPDNCMLWAVLSAMFCFLPTGIVAVMYARKVNRLWHTGHKYESEIAANNAMIWSLVSLAIGILLVAFCILFKVYQTVFI